MQQVKSLRSFSASGRAPAVRPPSRAVRARAVEAPSAAGPKSKWLQDLQYHSERWSAIESEEQFLGALKALVDAKLCPPQLYPAWQDFYNNYKNAMIASGDPEGLLIAAKVQSAIADCVFKQFKEQYVFPSLHTRIMEPYNYFQFGQRYVGSLIDFNASVLGFRERWDEIDKQLAAGHNVVLLANHQTEADPGVFAHMLATTNPRLSTDVFYVAGDRVVTDPLCVPFSMGRNLFCVHSKKHLDDVPELKKQKMETNRKTLIAMQRKMNEGGALIWIAPSGGRDRPKQDGKWSPDPFDPSAVELMRNLAQRAKQPGHLYPMAMYSYPLMPPPTSVEQQIGERRMTNFTGVGISVGAELDIASIISGIEDKEQQQQALASTAHAESCKEYALLEAAILDPAARKGTPQYSQPWLSA